MTYDAYGNTGGSKKDAAQQEAGAVKDTALSAGQDVKDTAVGEAADLKDHALDRAQGLLEHSRDQVGSRLSDGQNQLAQFVGEFADELQQMAHGKGSAGGYASEIAGKLASRGQDVASYLSNSEPSDVVEEVRRYAARRPMTFLGLALAGGVVAGRLVRGLQASQQSQGQLGTGRQFSDRQQFVGRQQSLQPGYSTYADQGTYTQRSTYAGQSGYTEGGTYGNDVRTPLGHEEHSGMFADTPDLGTQQGYNDAPFQGRDDFRGGQL